MEILKGMVKDAGYPDVECTYAKVDDNTLYYFIKDGELPNGNYIASNILKEAIEHAPFTSLGIIDKDGNILVPFENKVIKRVKDDLLLVEKNIPTSESVLNAIELRNDESKAQALAEESKKIKNQVTEVMGMNGTIVFDDHFSEATLYTMDGINVAGGYYSYIAELDSNYYFATNVVGEQIITFNPSMLEEIANTENSTDSSLEQSESELNVNIPLTDSEDNNQSEEITETSEVNNSEEVSNTNIDTVDSPSESDVYNDQIDETIENNSEQEKTNEYESNDNISDIPLVADPQGVENNESSEVSVGQEVEEDTGSTIENSDVSEEHAAQDDNEINFGITNSDDAENIQEESNNSEDTINIDLDEDNTNDVDFATEEDNDIENSNEEIAGSEADEVNSDLENDTTEIEEDNENFEDNLNESVEQNEVSNYRFTKENYTSPVIADATNTIKRLLSENKNQREIIDKQTGELEAYKSNYEILIEDNNLKKQEIVELREELNKYRNQTIALTRDNTKLKGTLMRQSQVMKSMEDQNTDLRKQVAGFSELNKAVAEAGVLITPVEDETSFSGLSRLYDEDDYSKKLAA